MMSVGLTEFKKQRCAQMKSAANIMMVEVLQRETTNICSALHLINLHCTFQYCVDCVGCLAAKNAKLTVGSTNGHLSHAH